MLKLSIFSAFLRPAQNSGATTPPSVKETRNVTHPCQKKKIDSPA